MQFLRQITEGIYLEDPFDDIHPDTLERYYGIDGPSQAQGPYISGAGHPADEQVDDDSDAQSDVDDDISTNQDSVETLENCIAHNQQSNIRHEPIKVARHHSPFTSAADEIEFFHMLEVVKDSGVTPILFGLHLDEWEGVSKLGQRVIF